MINKEASDYWNNWYALNSVKHFFFKKMMMMMMMMMTIVDDDGYDYMLIVIYLSF